MNLPKISSLSLLHNTNSQMWIRAYLRLALSLPAWGAWGLPWGKSGLSKDQAPWDSPFTLRPQLQLRPGPRRYTTNA